jgi:hypothetical protein
MIFLETASGRAWQCEFDLSKALANATAIARISLKNTGICDGDAMKAGQLRRIARRSLVHLLRAVLPLMRWGYRQAPHLAREVAEMLGIRPSGSTAGTALNRAMEDATTTIELKNSWHRRVD